jgi:hypothetical protein
MSINGATSESFSNPGCYGYNAQLNFILLAEIDAPVETGVWADCQKRPVTCNCLPAVAQKLG